MSTGSSCPRWTISSLSPAACNSSTMARPMNRVPPRTVILTPRLRVGSERQACAPFRLEEPQRPVRAVPFQRLGDPDLQVLASVRKCHPVHLVRGLKPVEVLIHLPNLSDWRGRGAPASAARSSDATA